MITITKSNPPMYLTPIDIRQRNHPAQNAFNNDADFSSIKQKLKQELLDEQGHICCFCMGKINQAEMKVARMLTRKVSLTTQICSQLAKEMKGQI